MRPQKSLGLCFTHALISEALRAANKKVDEQVFYSLVQYFAVVLFECNEAEDFGPAKTLMNMCFTFYHEVHPPTGPTLKHFLYSYLKDQPIWQSLRFWNAAFFDAVQYERARRPVPTRGTGKEGQVDDRHYQENITFGQLGTFTCNMRAFGLSRDLCLEFLRKQSTIASLREGNCHFTTPVCRRLPIKYLLDPSWRQEWRQYKAPTSLV
ncbi:hypothetical protein LSH36_224g07006 [Paralvinella palmiformis]|uniref:SBF1/SBF2 domain-containing protein n=1 Tax=Paralvinella palmiformis TaxID=53620 RepID=A0AAD9N5R2_9ANNE|nr:hypothetical protein LSH36_224g07006 [Paralvinella palmiformis]